MTKTKFDILFETAYSHYSNGGFRQNGTIKIKPSFLKSDYFRKLYSGNAEIADFITSLVKDETIIFIKRVVGNSNLDPKGAVYSGDPYLIVQTDPRIIQFSPEMSEFKLPCDWDYIENCEYGINLPPIKGVDNKYEHIKDGDKGVEWKDDSKIDNKSKDHTLPRKNTKI